MIISNKQLGVGLVELMIALVIGLFLVGGVLTIFTNNKRTYLYQQSQGVEDEYQRLASTVFGVMLRQAGHATMSTDAIWGKKVIFDSNETPFSINGQVVVGERTAGSETRDSISYRFMGGLGIFGCNGIEIPDETILRQEKLSISSEGVLNCVWGTGADENINLIGDTNVPVAQQLEVQALTITYGLDSVGNNDSIDEYQRAEDVTDWQQVKSAVIQMTMKSGLRKAVTMRYAIEFPNLIGSL